MSQRIKFLMMLVLVSLPMRSFAFSSAEKEFMDSYIAKQNSETGVAISIVDEMERSLFKRVGNLESKVNQIAPFLTGVRRDRAKVEFQLDDLLKRIEAAGKTEYDDKEWVSKAEKKLLRYCCTIQTDSGAKERAVLRSDRKKK